MLTGAALVAGVVERGYVEGGAGWRVNREKVKTALTGYGGPHRDRDEAVDAAIGLMEQMGPIEEGDARDHIRALLENEHDLLCERPVG